MKIDIWNNLERFYKEMHEATYEFFYEYEKDIEPDITLVKLPKNGRPDVFPVERTKYTKLVKSFSQYIRDIQTFKTLRIRPRCDKIEIALDAKFKTRKHFVIYFKNSSNYKKNDLDYGICIISFKNKYLNDLLLKNVRENIAKTLFWNCVLEKFKEFCDSTVQNIRLGGSLNLPYWKNAIGEMVMDSVFQLNFGDEWDFCGGIFYSTCTEVASMKYEKRISSGSIVLGAKDARGKVLKPAFKEIINMWDSKRLRKLLECCDDDMSLMCDYDCCYGLGKVSKKSKKLWFNVRFKEQYVWELYTNDSLIMVVKFGKPHPPKPILDKLQFEQKIKEKFPKMPKTKLGKIWELSLAATRQVHGTTLVISNKAAAEAKRLSQQSTCIIPCDLDIGFVNNITSIDGAVMIDHNGICHAFGVILDGIAVKTKGDPTRGARYNSSVRYIEYTKNKPRYKSLAIVISEDGSIDFIS